MYQTSPASTPAAVTRIARFHLVNCVSNCWELIGYGIRMSNINQVKISTIHKFMISGISYILLSGKFDMAGSTGNTGGGLVAIQHDDTVNSLDNNSYKPILSTTGLGSDSTVQLFHAISVDSSSNRFIASTATSVSTVNGFSINSNIFSRSLNDLFSNPAAVWNAVGDQGVNGVINSMLVINNILYLAGFFTSTTVNDNGNNAHVTSYDLSSNDSSGYHSLQSGLDNDAWSI